MGTNYTLVDTKTPEFDYPGGTSGDVYTHYTGSGGIPIDSFFNRLAFSVRFGTIRFFTSNSIEAGQPDHPAQQHRRPRCTRPRRSSASIRTPTW